MNNARKYKVLKPEQGVSLIITFFVMIIILSVTLSISSLLYSEVKVIRNVSNSTAGLYAADSGVEKVLYYDRQVVPEGAVRGLCSMFDLTNNNGCVSESGIENSIYCLDQSITSLDNGGCNIDRCDNCTVYFSTNFDNKTHYITTVKIFPYENKSIFEIDSKGISDKAQRQIQVIMSTTNQ